MDVLRSAVATGAATAQRLYTRNWARRRLVRAKMRLAASLVSPDFRYGRYPHTFLERQPPPQNQPSSLPRVIWSFWVGDNPLTPAREVGLASLRDINPTLDVTLVTPDLLGDYIVDGHPLHPSYEHLSYNHRSDYLRAYFLHHHGGGYADIKPIIHPWAPAFERLETSDAWLLGPPLTDAAWAGNPSGKLEAHLRRYYYRIPSGTMLISKSHTPLTAEWLREIERRLEYHSAALVENPGGTWGQDPSYPIEWMGLQGNIFQPLALKHLNRVLLDPRLLWDQTAKYR